MKRQQCCERPLPSSVRDEVLRRLGCATTGAPDHEILRTIYRAWCDRVPFDNVRKMIAIRAGHDRSLPGSDAADFFESWQTDGTGGTCWPSSNALFELARAIGFDAVRVAGCMRDLGVINHGSVKVHVAQREFLIDSSFLCNRPLPLFDAPYTLPDPVVFAKVEADSKGYVVWTESLPEQVYLPCRIDRRPVHRAFFIDRYEASRERSPFNHRLYARRNQPDGFVLLSGCLRIRKTASGVESRELRADELCEALHRDIGISNSMIEQWIDSGSLADSLHSAAPMPPLSVAPSLGPIDNRPAGCLRPTCPTGNFCEP